MTDYVFPVNLMPTKRKNTAKYTIGGVKIIDSLKFEVMVQDKLDNVENTNDVIQLFKDRVKENEAHSFSIANNLNLYSHIRPNLIKKYGEIAKELVKISARFKEQLLIVARDYFMVELIKQDVISAEKFSNRYQKFDLQKYYLAPFVGKYPPKKMEFDEFREREDILKYNNFELYKEVLEYGYKKDSIQFALKNDDLDSFISLAGDDFDINTMLIQSPFEVQLIPVSPLTTFCARYGSKRCFSFLAGIGAPIDHTAAVAAAASGSISILEELSALGADLKFCQQTAARFHRADVFDWAQQHNSLSATPAECLRFGYARGYCFCLAHGSNADYCWTPSIVGTVPGVAALYGNFSALARVSMPEDCGAIVGKDALRSLIIRGCESEAVDLIKRGFDVRDSSSREQLTHVAAAADSVPVLRALKAAFCDLNTPGIVGETPLMTALRHKARRAAQYLIEAGADINATDENGLTAVHYAAAAGDADFTAFLMRAARPRPLSIPIIAAAAAGDNADLVRALAASGADVDAISEQRIATAPWQGFTRECSEHVRELEPRYGDSIPGPATSGKPSTFGGTSSFGQTSTFGQNSLPLFASSIGLGQRISPNRMGDSDFGEKTFGAKIGGKPPAYALQANNQSNMYCIQRISGGTPLHVSAQFDALASIEALLEAGADIDRSFNGKTPLQTAIFYNHHKAAELLIKKGAKLPQSAVVERPSLALRRLLKEYNVTPANPPANNDTNFRFGK